MTITTVYQALDEGQRDFRFAIESNRGQFVAGVDRREVATCLERVHPLDLVRVWHPVPRWMTLGEAVNELIL